MTARAMSWAWDQPTGTPLAKLILLRIADGAGMDGDWLAGPGEIETLASWAAATVDEVEDAIGELVASDLLFRVAPGRYRLPGPALA